MVTLINNNPYRVLGVYSNATLKEITANRTRLAAYAKVGKSVDFKSDKVCNLPLPVRDINTIAGSIASINLPVDKLKYALFWFLNATSIDGVAISNLEAEDTTKAKEILSKRQSYSSLINLGVLHLLDGDYNKSVECLTSVIHNDEYRGGFIEAIAGTTFVCTETKLAHIYIDALMSELPNVNWMQVFAESGESSEDDDYIKGLIIGAPLKTIENLIAYASNQDRKDAQARYEAGKKLMVQTKKPLSLLKTILGADSTQYEMIADRLAKEILQCGIDYYNNTDDEDDVENAMVIQKYALSIAASQLTKDRCKENCDTLSNIKNRKSIDVHLERLKTQLETFSNGTKSIIATSQFVSSCKSTLSDIKAVIGINADYLQYSSIVVNLALGSLVDVINREQENQFLITNGTLKRSIESALNVLSQIGQMDMDSQTRNRYNTNKTSLVSLQSSVNQLMTRLSSSNTGSYSSSSSNDNSNIGCFIVVIIIGIIMIVINSL